MKIAIYSICKNEQLHIQRYLEMAQEADAVFVLDTGSTDKSMNMLQQGCNTLHLAQIDLQPWRFDVARNLNLKMVPEDFDLCMWMDFDEYFAPGWRKIIESAYDKEITRYRNKFRNITTGFEYYHFKIHKRADCFWEYPIHEQLTFKNGEKIAHIDKLICEHHQDLSKDRTFYISMIETYLKSGDLPMDHYVPLLIREYFVNRQFDLCKMTFEKYYDGLIALNLPRFRKANCLRYYITSLEELGLPRSDRLIEEYAQTYPLRDHYYVAAWAMRKIKNYKRALEFLQLGDLNPSVDSSGEFIHPSARTPKYERLRANIINEMTL